MGYSPWHYKELDTTERLTQYIIKVCTLLFRHNTIAHYRPQHNVNISFL